MNIQSALVHSILTKASAYAWSVQGFGMLRTKLLDVGRIHVWDSTLTVDRVSTIHAHPWPLKSTIISGELINQRFERIESNQGLPYTISGIKTGEGGGLVGKPELIYLRSRNPELYVPGDVYEQEPKELHRTIAQDGTVTLLERPMGEPLQETVVLWPAGTFWGSAEPRPAEDHERDFVIAYALARWNAP